MYLYVKLRTMKRNTVGNLEADGIDNIFERCPQHEPDFEVETVPFEFKGGYFVSGDIRIATKDVSDLINNFPTALEWLEKPF